ncbi:hypothetical protein COCMIDRAFT_30772 [Bipolaris oryzae ATCC 44560]|uniref:Uncharacterized protein n=1 Tax=Bipolaris oryzae ATCC 44560 TaxID=930090 RepID=W6YRM0_COCMI|nr:uncharacterized protein COCMIDRAFT_30772 [Bipolaris oryzae ATCC 44560]EUC40260.1 hypothetical protein COCMIDRAFT_30772 [Bipolaris oryzae ATCC 44560]
MSFPQEHIIAPKGPFKLVTVNTAPERAKVLIGRVMEALKDKYTIEYVANCVSKDQVASSVHQHQPDILFSASMWTADDVVEIQQTAQSIKPDIRLHAIPFGLQTEKGPDAIVEHLLHQIPLLL